MDTGPKQRREMNPRYGANLFSILTFGWTLETFKMGYSRDIKDTDLYAPLPEHRSNVLGDAMQKAWDCEEQNAQRRGERCKPSLWRVLFKVFGCELMLYGLILAAMEFLIRSSNSTYLYRLFSYYDMEGSVSWGEAVFFAFGIVCCSTLNIMVQHPFMMGAMHMGMKMRVGVCSLIYRKALKVNIQATSESSGGLVLNLMANDVNRFDTGPLFAHYLWIGPLETLLMTVYLYREMGMPAVYGSLIILAVIPFQIFLGLNTAYYRRGTAEKSDERVRLMQEIIMGIEVIKMYTWEKPFQKIIDSVRRHEVFYIKMTSYIRGVIMSFIMFTSRFGIFITVLLYVTYVNRITVENVFFLTCYYNITKQTMTLYFPQAVGQIFAGSLTTVIGAVGSGKSTLLHMVLSELPCTVGAMEVNGTVSYASQDPWLFVGSVRQNILFGQSFQKQRYMEVCKVCALERDISLFPHGDKTVVGERGVSLSGGQRARINLARAVYKEEKELKIIQLMNEKVREVHEEENVPSFQSVSMLFQPSTLSLHRRHWSMMLDMSVDDQKPEAEVQATGRVHGSVYRDYFMAGAPCCLVIIVGFLFLLAQFCASACDYWISRWSNTEDRLSGDATMDVLIWSEQGLGRKDFVLIFGIITLATIIVALIRAFFFFSLCMKSSIKLHDQMFESISRSPMSFFHTNPSGRILNRFSKDMGAVDELLPQAMIDCFQIILNLLGVVIVILMTDITLLIPITAAMVIFYIFRVIYIRTTGAVKRLEGITRSPVFGHVNATILGLATIRSFGAEFLLAEEFDLHQDLHSAAWYLFITCSRSFGYFLDLICLLFIICVTFSCLMKTDMDGSYVGLAITQSISLTGIFQWGMRQSAEMENQMTSVERVMEYTKLPQEAAIRSAPEKKPPADWPAEGLIKFDNLSLKYSPEGAYVLQRLQFTIEPQEKIGIVGRTGAGKSSIIQALFRLAYLEGTITIDGVDIMSIGLHDLREKLSIIPQEPVLFSGNIRKNLDPFDQYPDSVLMEALNNVELQAEGDESPLYKEVSEGGCNFSVGERQLVCLARAIVHNDRILVLDEATANVDAQTDQLIQTAIRLHFSSCTVLTVAHRLNTIIDSDKILVLDAGRLMEFDHPHILLQNKKGYFRKMVSETGPTMTSLLHKQAAQSYMNRQTGK
ncbi:hypothetical protein PYW07_014392 [Mythimna separata]|uniref:Multidrug resistance-associated protein lethal(2)03659 n=1 Tax=Mythimna separata TaxID=271217 RepID=A0AAD8E016_MYTSE|nr:hypothetical protein PYW07_014392 [Mythimna separata]